MKHKSFKPIKADYGDEGSIRLVFATLNVIDSDGDVTMPGAFTDGEEVLISAYGHSSWGSALPVGKGSIREIGDQAVFEGKFFMDTDDGQKTYQTVKNVGPLQEFSYGYDPLKRSFGEFEGREDVRFLEKLKVYEVSPVLAGAGVGTRILDIKDGADASRGRFVDHIESVLDDARDLVERAKSIREKRKEKDRDLSDERKEQLRKSAAEFSNLAQALESLTADPVDASALFLQSQRTLDRVRTTIGGTV